MLTSQEIKEQKRIKGYRKRVEKWLVNNAQFINMSGLEREIKAPKGLVQKFLKYDVPIKDEWIISLHNVLKHLTSFSNLK